MMSGYDIIGDIHGYADSLKRLLAKLGYHGFSHPDGRRIIFVGDYIDRGPRQMEVIDIVRSFQDAGIADVLMGNHEFNAICYAEEGRFGPIRPHTASNNKGHGAFLKEFSPFTPEYRSAIDWFKTLPIYLENKDFRAIHACWNDNAINACAPFMKEDLTLADHAYSIYDRGKGTSFYNGIETLLKGPEYVLPKGGAYPDTDGNIRTSSRLFWWGNPEGGTDALLSRADKIGVGLDDNATNRLVKLRNCFNYASQKPVFIGHYSIPTEPYLTSSKVACLNFQKTVVAYQWNEGDTGLNPYNLVYSW